MLMAYGMTRAGALGTIGNLMAESTPELKPDIVQRGMTKLSDEQYTAAVDNGFLDFALDHIGYGLAQFTYSKRKENLLAFAKACGTSVGDGEMQVRFIVKEMKEDFPSVWNTLCTSNDINQCTDVVCTQYERPAVNNLTVRRGYAHEVERTIPENAFKENTNNPVFKTFPPNATVIAFQMWMQYNGYWDSPITGYKNAYFFKQLRQFVDDMEKC
jgi:hypothetical protein